MGLAERRLVGVTSGFASTAAAGLTNWMCGAALICVWGVSSGAACGFDGAGA